MESQEPRNLAAGPPAERASILLAGHDPTDLASLRAILGDLGVDLVEARSGEEALDQAEAREFAAILLDVLLPGPGGFETAQAIRADERHRLTPIIFLAEADIGRAQIERGYALGAVDVLERPLSPVVVRAKVGGLVTLIREKERARHEADQLRMLVQGTTDFAIFMLDPQGHVTTWNAGAERLKGYTAEEIVGQHFSRFYPQDALDRGWPDHELRVAEAEGRFEDEGWRLRKDGSRFWANVVITTLRDDQGRLRGFSKVTRDLTARKQAEESLRRSEERFRLLIEGAKDYAIFMLDPQGHVASWNLGADRIKGYSAHEIIGQHFSRFYPQEAIDRGWPDHELRVAAVEGRFEDEGWRVRKDGTLFWANVVITALRDERGDLLGFSKITRDMTQRKRAEEDARRLAEETAARRAVEENARLVQQERERLQVTLASIGDAVISTDARGCVDYLNPVAEELVGWQAAEAAGRALEDVFRIVNEDTRQPVENPSLRALRDGRIVGLANHTVLISKDGTERPIDDSAAPIRDLAGRVVGAVLVFRDISERRSAEGQARTILESISDAFFALDRGWRFTYVNRQAEGLLGRTRGDLLGKHIWEEYAPAVGTEFDRSYHRAMDEGVTVTFEAFYPPHDRWYEVHAYPSESGISVYFRDIGERRRHEEEHARLTAASEQQRRIYETALSSTPDLTYVFDLEGRFVFANAALLGLWRKGPDEALGRRFSDLDYTPELAARLQRQILQVIDTKEPVRDETPYTSHLGERQYEYIFVPVLGAGGAVEAVAGSTRDITERKRAEEALRRGEERLRLIVESATDYAIFSMDPDGRIATWNSGARNLVGYEEGEILGRDLGVLYTPEDIERGIPEQETRKALDRGRAENERWHVRKDGTRFWASGLLMPMRDGDEVVGLLKIMRDTTEQKRTEHELEVSRERLDLVVNSSEVGLWYCDLPFDKLVWNPKCKEHFGLPPDAEVTIETFFGRIHPDDREATRRAIGGSVEGHTEYDTEFRTVDEEGRVRWVRAIGQPFYDVDGTPIRFDGITVDVTGRIEQEQALREADRRKDEFLATLAHELRNPLAPIRNVLHFMRQADGDGPMEAERAMAERQVVHLARLIDDLMDVARISRGKIDLHQEVVDLARVVNQAVETARPQIDERRHRLTVSLPDEAIRLEGDPTRLEQVLWNLLNNAAKYMEPGGEFALTVEPGAGDVLVRVRDTGIGIRPEMLPKVFDMFVQVDDHKGHAQGGLGIGLSLVKTLVEMHGGTITADSDGPGRGSEFVVRLPVLSRAQETEAVDRDRRRDQDDKPPSRRILVVDDNVDAAKSLARLLARLYGQEVRVAHDGPEALAAADEFLPEVVLLDIGLPGMDGNEVARRLRERPEFRKALLVALTGWGQESDIERSREAGFDRHLVKPADPESIRSLLIDHKTNGAG